MHGLRDDGVMDVAMALYFVVLYRWWDVMVRRYIIARARDSKPDLVPLVRKGD